MIKNIIFLLLISFNSFGQLTPTQLTQVNGLIATAIKNVQTDYNTKIKSLQDRCTSLEHDSIALDSKFFAFINGKWTFVGVGNSQAWIDSISKVINQINSNTKQLFTNDQQLASTLNDSAKKAFDRWHITDSITGQNNGALRGLGNLVSTAGKKIDTLNQQVIPQMRAVIMNNTADIKAATDISNTTQGWADKVKAYFSNIFINFPL